MAGMSAMFLGEQIQPTVFFRGYSDLMSKYFSAGDGPMNIISGNILVLDHRQVKICRFIFHVLKVIDDQVYSLIIYILFHHSSHSLN